MSVTAHIDVLEKKHNLLKREIEQAYTHHVSDTELLRLKKRKLALKDEIWAYKQRSRQKVAA